VKKDENNTGTIVITGLEPNRTYMVYIKVIDNAGWDKDSDQVSAITKGELKPPRITPNTLSAYYTGNVTISIADTAEAGKTRATKIKYKRTENGTEETINGTSGSFEINTDGVYKIYACMEDANGVKSAWVNTNQFTRDATRPNAPSITTNPASPNGNNGWYKSGNITVNITAGTDATSGPNYIRYSLDDGASWTNTAAGTTGHSFTISTNSITKIRAYTYDRAGNVSSNYTSKEIKRDATAPAPTLGTPTATTNSISVTATANESGGSGVYSYQFQYKTSANGTWTNHGSAIISGDTTKAYTYANLNDGQMYWIRVVVADGAR